MNRVDTAAEFWDREHASPQYCSWMEHPLIREAINRRIGGATPMWPVDWFSRRTRGRSFARALSIGCGTGALERDLLSRGVCERIDALDASVASVATARRLATEIGVAAHYFLADFNRLGLPRRHYDLVIFHQSLHHVDALENLLPEVMRALRPDGLVLLDEYVGPSRSWWSPGRFRLQRSVYDALPAAVRALPKLPLPVHAFDPSEAVRSGAILPLLRVGFTIVTEQSYGGNLLAPIFPALASNVDDHTLGALVEQEEALLSDGHPSHYRVIIARPRTGPAAVVARLLYRILGIAHSSGIGSALLRVRRLSRRIYVAMDRRIRRRPIDHYT